MQNLILTSLPQHSRKLYGRECYCSLHITSQALYAREFLCPSALHSPPHHDRHSHPLATLQPWPELNRMPRNLLVVVQPLPAGPVPYQSNPRHPHLAQSETISALIIQETTT